uniref:Uncharacterized protein n=1 Tax=Leersia perrieri TaxID=77586 RepID=A0A0D9WPX8_9ORYZ
MNSTEDNHSSLFYPNLERIVLTVQSRTLVDPVYICVECTAVHKNQHAMASHCRIHIHSDDMAKGTCTRFAAIPMNTNFNSSGSKPLASQTGIIGASDLLQKCLSRYIPQPASAKVGSTLFVPAATPAVDLTLRLGPGPTAP